MINKEKIFLKYRYIYFVHEFTRSVGHSNALIETIKRLPTEVITNSKVYCFFYDKELCDELKGITIKSLGPYPKFPFILKVLYFQLICLILKLFKKRNDIWISIGTANLWPDIINIQFIQKQWAPMFFNISKPKGVVLLYKKILFFILTKQEDYTFNNNKFYSVLAPFMRSFLTEELNINEDRIKVLPSSVDVSRFSPEEIKFKDVVKKYPELANLNSEETIYLFVGALERKGYYQALKSLEKIGENVQFLVVGKGEAYSKNNSTSGLVEIFHIPFTKEIHEIFAISDCFIFPTQYEPFGLVIFEAFAAGLDVYVTRDKVGASDLISDDENVHLIEDIENFEIKLVDKLSLELKKKRILARKDIFERYSWDQCSNGFFQLIKDKISELDSYK